MEQIRLHIDSLLCLEVLKRPPIIVNVSFGSYYLCHDDGLLFSLFVSSIIGNVAKMTDRLTKNSRDVTENIVVINFF